MSGPHDDSPGRLASVSGNGGPARARSLQGHPAPLRPHALLTGVFAGGKRESKLFAPSISPLHLLLARIGEGLARVRRVVKNRKGTGPGRIVRHSTFMIRYSTFHPPKTPEPWPLISDSDSPAMAGSLSLSAFPGPRPLPSPLRPNSPSDQLGSRTSDPLRTFGSRLFGFCRCRYPPPLDHSTT